LHKNDLIYLEIRKDKVLNIFYRKKVLQRAARIAVLTTNVFFECTYWC